MRRRPWSTSQSRRALRREPFISILAIKPSSSEKSSVFARTNAPAPSPPHVVKYDSPFSVLMQTARYAIDVSLNDKTAGLMRLMVAEHNRFPELTKKVANASFERFQRNVEQVFVQLHRSGHIPAGDHLESARLFIDLILGATPLYGYMEWLDGPPSPGQLKTKVQLLRGRSIRGETCEVAPQREHDHRHFAPARDSRRLG